MRVRYAPHRKCGLIAALKRMQAKGMSLCATASELRVSATNLSKWALHGVGKIDHLDKILRSKKKTALTGPVSQLKAIEGALLHYIFEHREQGVMVNTFMVALRVSCILPEFHGKKLHNALQLCEALFDCPFVLISNGHAHVATSSGQN